MICPTCALEVCDRASQIGNLLGHLCSATGVVASISTCYVFRSVALRVVLGDAVDSDTIQLRTFANEVMVKLSDDHSVA